MKEGLWQAGVKNILVVANVSAGKSTLVNAIIGYPITKAKTTACTSRLAFIKNKPTGKGVTILDKWGRRSWLSRLTQWDSSSFLQVVLPFNSLLSEAKVSLIDTPGFNNGMDSSHRQITADAIRGNRYDLLLYVSNCQYLGTDDEHRLLSFIRRHTDKPIVFALNQLDRFKSRDETISDSLHDYKDFLLSLGFHNPVVRPVSARAALLFKMPYRHMKGDDRLDRSIMKKKFTKPYYDLPYYIGRSGKSLLDKTGIGLLEETLLEL